MNEITFVIGIRLLFNHSSTWSRRNTGPARNSAIGRGKSAKRDRQFVTAGRETCARAAISWMPTNSSPRVVIYKRNSLCMRDASGAQRTHYASPIPGVKRRFLTVGTEGGSKSGKDIDSPGVRLSHSH